VRHAELRDPSFEDPVVERCIEAELIKIIESPGVPLADAAYRVESELYAYW